MNKLRSFGILVLLWWTAALHAEAAVPDSLLAQLEAVRADSAGTKLEARLMIRIGKIQGLTAVDSAVVWFQRARAVGEKINEPSLVASALGEIANLYSSRSLYILALQQYLDAYAILNENGYEDSVGHILVNIGNIYHRKAVYSTARDYFARAEAVFQRADDAYGIILTHNSRAEGYQMIGKPDSAEYHFQEGAKYLDEIRDTVMLAYNLHIRGRLKLETGDPAGARQLGLQAIALMGRVAHTLPPDHAEYGLYPRMIIMQGKYYEGNADSIEFWLNRAAQQLERMPAMEKALDYCEIDWSRGVRAIEAKKYHKAIRLLEAALACVIDRGGDARMDYQISTWLAEAYGGIKDYKEAARRWRENWRRQLNMDNQQLAGNLMEFNTTVKTFEQARELKAAEFKAETERLERENAIRTRNLVLAGTLLLLLLAAGLAFLYRRIRGINRELNEKNRLIAENATQLSDLNATKDKLLSIIGHDMRTPFNALLGFSGIVRNQIDQAASPRLKQSLETIHDSSQHAYYLFEDLLAWTNSQTGKLAYAPEVLDLEVIVAQVIQLYKGNADSSGVELQAQLQSRYVHADAYMLRTMLRNLVANAIRHTPAGGEVAVCSAGHGDRIVVEVRDTGAGMDAATAAQATASPSPTAGNRGLGLQLVNDFAARHGTQIIVESQAGEGSSISFELSRAEGPQVQDAPAALAGNAGTVVLPADSRGHLGQWQAVMQDLKLYEVSRWDALIAEMEAGAPPAAAIWLAQLNEIVHQFDESRFAAHMTQLQALEAQE